NTNATKLVPLDEFEFEFEAFAAANLIFLIRSILDRLIAISSAISLISFTSAASNGSTNAFLGGRGGFLALNFGEILSSTLFLGSIKMLTELFPTSSEIAGEIPTSSLVLLQQSISMIVSFAFNCIGSILAILTVDNCIYTYTYI
ncbi:hypothetical protein MIMGU_mgv1a0181272mg, partial [Erythranthe guttata]